MTSVRTLCDVSRDFSIPPFQRGIEWTEEDVFSLLDFMVRGFPCGQIVIWNVYGKPDRQWVIDGQQRLAALTGFRPGEASKTWDVWIDLETQQWRIGDNGNAFPAAATGPIKTEIYSRLSQKHGDDFNGPLHSAIKKSDDLLFSHIPVTMITDVTPDEIREVFRRINTAGRPMDETRVEQLLKEAG